MLVLLLSLLLPALLAAWLMSTAAARHQYPHWGPDSVAWFAATFCKLLCALFGLTFAIEESDKAAQSLKRPFIAVVSPHGCFPLTMIGLGAWRFRPGLKGITDSRFDRLNARFAGASVLFSIPLLRELLLLCGVRDASGPSMKRLIEEGATVAVNPGGIWEMVQSRADGETAFVQKGLGFIRIAMETGTPLVPCYSFGENQVLRGSGFLIGPRLWIARRFRVGLPLFTGRWGLPYPFAMPLPTKVTFVIGRQIEVGPPNANPTESQVDDIFQEYLSELCRVFLENAPRLLPSAVAAKGLRIERIGHGIVREVFPQEIERD